jgi:hypothetical protein
MKSSSKTKLALRADVSCLIKLLLVMCMMIQVVGGYAMSMVTVMVTDVLQG